MAPSHPTVADPTMPRLALILDEALMAGEFTRALFAAPGGMPPVVSCQTLWIKYKPGQNCTVAYRLTCADGAAQLLYGRIYADGGALRRLAAARAACTTPPLHGAPMVYLASVEMLCWLFPNDRKLDGLAKLADREWLATHALPEVVGAVFGADWRLDDFTSTIVHFVPEHSCTVSVDLEAVHGRSGAHARQRVYGKTYYNRAGAETYRQMCALWRQSLSLGDGLGLARPIAYRAPEKILWQAHVAGATLLDQGIGSAEFSTALAPAAAALARLHGAAMDCAHRVTLEMQLAKLRRTAGILSAALPAAGERIDRLVSALLRQTEALPRRADVTLHGDLHLGNIISANGKAALIDLDGLCRGPALCDLGSLIAALICHGVVNEIADAELTAITAAFCAHYRGQIGWRFSDAELAWYVAAALVNERIYRCLTRMKFHGRDIVGQLLDQAAGLAGQAVQR